MAEEDRKSTSSTRQTETKSQETTTTQTKTLKVELLALSWSRQREDGKGYYNHQRGDVIEVPEHIVKSLNEGAFKPSFRVLGDNE